MYDKIRQLCESHGTTIKRLEKELGIGNGTIGKWRDSSPRVDLLKKVADYFGITVDELVSE